jgi:hypothetical protein
MERALSWDVLHLEFERLEDRDEILQVDLKGRDPDENVTQVPYEKGALFLRTIEDVYGREQFDAFLRGYFEHFAFQSITTPVFVDYLRQNLLKEKPMPDLEAWLRKPGLPQTAQQPRSEALQKVDAIARAWTAREIPTTELPVKAWTTQETLRFLRSLPRDTGAARMAELDKVYGFTSSGNYEVLFEWMMMAIRNGYDRAYPRLDRFLLEVGRRKYLRPLYEELVRTRQGRERAQRIYQKARSAYHPITQSTVEKIVRQ